MTGAGARGWWRRNALALIALAAIAGTAAWLQTSREWHATNDYASSQPVEAARGETLEFDGARYTVTGVDRLYPGGLPRGTAAVRVTVEVEAQPGESLPQNCIVLLSETGGSHGDREWRDAVYSDAEILEVEGTESDCLPDEEGQRRTRFTLAVPFVIPDDADGTLTLAIEVSEAIPRYPVLELGPLP